MKAQHSASLRTVTGAEADLRHHAWQWRVRQLFSDLAGRGLGRHRPRCAGGVASLKSGYNFVATPGGAGTAAAPYVLHHRRSACGFAGVTATGTRSSVPMQPASSMPPPRPAPRPRQPPLVPRSATSLTPQLTLILKHSAVPKGLRCA